MIITDTGIRIDLPLADYSKRRNSTVKECYLMLYPEYIQYKIVGEYESQDEDTEVWEEKIANYRWLRLRTNLSEVTMHYDNPEKLWSMGIDFIGISEGNCWLFQDPKEALKIYNQLTEYMLR